MNKKDLDIYLGFILIVAAAFFLRFYQLDLRVFHHDEAAVGYFTYKLFNDGTYSYDPSFHGPFMYYVTAEMYRRFGDSVYSSRILPAIFGASMLLLLIPLRKYIGNTGMVLAAFFFAFSPSFLYYSRFYREDIFISFFTLLMLVCAVKYAEKYAEDKYYIRKVSGLYLSLGGVLILSIAALWISKRALAENPKGDLYIVTTLILAAIIVLILLFGSIYSDKNIEYNYSVLRIFYLSLGAVALASMAALKENAYIAMALIAFFLFLLFIREILLFIRQKGYEGLLQKLKRPDKRALITAAEGVFFILVVLVVFSIFYTGKFLDLYGVKAAVEKAIYHWYEMHSIQRMGGPYFFYLPIIALYELPILIFGIFGIAYFGGCDKKKEKVLTMLLAYWVAVDILYLVSDYYPASSRFLPTSYIQTSIVIFFPLLVLGIIIVLKARNLFFAFLTYWAMTNLIAYSYVQEKVPWLVLNPLLPLVIIAGAYIGELLSRLRFTSRTGAAMMILLVACLYYFVYASALLNYYDYANPAEPLIQAAQPPQRFSQFLDKVKEVSSQYQNQSTEIQLTDPEMETQFLWYMRHYANIRWKVNISSELNAPLIVAHDGDGNDSEANIVQRRLRSDYIRLNSAKMSWYWFKASDITLDYLLYRKMDGPPGEYRFALFYKPKVNGLNSS